MQNKPNLPENQVNASSVLTKGYEADIVFWPKNPKPNSNPIKPNFKRPKADPLFPCNTPTNRYIVLRVCIVNR